MVGEIFRLSPYGRKSEVAPPHVNDASATVRNELPFPVPVSDVRYTVRLNGVVVGQGSGGGDAVVPAGGTERLELRAAIDNSKLDRWWVTHRRRGGRSTLSVAFDAVVEYDGTEQRLSLNGAAYNRTFRTDIFDNGASRNRSNAAASAENARGRGA